MDSLLSYGSFGSYRTGFGINGPLSDKVYARIDGSHADEGGYVTRTGNRMRSMAASIRWTPAESVSFKAQGIYTDDVVNAYYGTPLVNGTIDPRTRFINYNMRDNLNKAHNNYGKIDADIQLPGAWRLRNEAFAATQRVDWWISLSFITSVHSGTSWSSFSASAESFSARQLLCPPGAVWCGTPGVSGNSLRLSVARSQDRRCPSPETDLV
jgi:hypothetical protein